MSADGSEDVVRLTESEHTQWPVSWSSNGRFLTFTELGPERQKVWLLSVDDGEVTPLLDTKDDHGYPVLSPDGKWLAYGESTAAVGPSGSEIFVRPFPGPGPRIPISNDGGHQPVWSPDGRELFYRSGDRGREIRSVAIERDPSFTASRPRRLFEGIFEWSRHQISNYNISHDGERFVMVYKEDTPAQIVVIFNWFDELNRLVPTN